MINPEANWWIIGGLVLDIVGASLIIGPWLYFRKITRKRLEKEVFENQKWIDDEVDIRNKQRTIMLIGFGALVLGFGLQILGNLTQ